MHRTLSAVFLVVALLGSVPTDAAAYRVLSGGPTRTSRRELRRAQRLQRRAPSSASSSSRSRFSSSSASSVPGRVDESGDVSVRSRVLILGDVTSVLGAVKIFPSAEAIDVRSITVRLVGDPTSVESLSVYESSTGRFLGTASRQSAGTYLAPIPAGTFTALRRADTSVYVRASLRSPDNGGTGAESIRIDAVTVRGFGVWSNDEYAVSSGETFPAFETARSVLLSVTNVDGSTSAAFAAGDDQVLGTFAFTGRSADARHTPRVTSLTFRLAMASGVSIVDPRVTVVGTDVSSSCAVSATTVTCSSLPPSIGTVDGTQAIRLLGDVAVAPGTSNPFLQASLSDPGSPSSPGDITWTDGVDTLDWLPLDTPMARGVKYD